MENVKVTINENFKKELKEKHENNNEEVKEFIDGVRLMANSVEEFDGVYNEIREESEQNGELVVEAINYVEDKTGTQYDDVVEFTSELRNELDVDYINGDEEDSENENEKVENID